VSGDFYWFTKNNGKFFIAAVDCTGHGVPGAFLSLIGNSLLTEIVLHNSVQDPAEILQQMHEQLIVTLKKEAKESSTVDGMDVSLVVIDETHKRIEFASTGRPLIYLSDEKIKMIKTGKHPLGLILKKEKRYQTYHLDIKAGDFIYIFTDGFCDQFGGETGEKYLYSRFHDLLLSINKEDIKRQEELLEQALDLWRGNIPQIDDILIIGMKF
jgi:serine phosphatase RsbU (regulator of sigma subunit)